MATQAQVNNNVDMVQNNAGSLLSIITRLEMDVDFCTAIGGTDAITATPPSGENSGITASAYNNVIAHINAIIAEVNNRKSAIYAILDGVPK